MIENRKNEHLHLCKDNRFDLRNQLNHPFDQFYFEYDALPEIDANEIDLSVNFLGTKLKAPILIGAMTGGTPEADRINAILLEAANETGIPFSYGSQRIALENNHNVQSFKQHLNFNEIPFIFGNLGAVQLNYGLSTKLINQFCNETNIDGLFLHLNPLQEIIQDEGNHNFKDLLSKINDLTTTLNIPIFIKEVGAGISEKTAKKLSTIALAGIETAGVGGTSWSMIESARSKITNNISTGQLFSGFGINTPDSILASRKYFENRIVIASGGIRNGLDIAKSLSLGADLCALARPFFIEAQTGVKSVIHKIECLKHELRTILFLTGSKQITDLPKLHRYNA